MAKVADVATYILEKQGKMSAWKLQKLVYYCQAWSLVWSEAPIFEEPIEAWANGPVSPALYELHKGDFTVKRLYDKEGNPVGDANALTDEERETVQVVLNDYGHQSGQWLSELAHMEDPWRDARRRCGRKPGDRCSEVITHNEMALYYGGLLQSDAAETEDSRA